MLAGTWNFTIETNSAFSRSMTVRDTRKRLVNFTGYSARLTVQEVGGEEVTTLTSSSGIVLTEKGGVTISIAQSVVETMSPDKQYAYDLVLIAPDTVTPIRLLAGTITLVAGITIPFPESGA